MHTQNKHEFSLYWPKISAHVAQLKAGETFQLDDVALHHRITKILRLAPDEIVILFDQKNNLRVEFLAITKNTIEFKLLAKYQNTIHKPYITFLLPILKRDALEQAVYSLVELGANEIQLIHTQKVQRTWGEHKERLRLQNIIVAAAEQSKNYVFPELREPQDFQKVIDQFAQTDLFFFDPAGEELFPVLENLRTSKTQKITLLIGPEGDLTPEEKNILQKRNVQFCKLTPTILRAQQAIAVALGIFRSLLH